MAILGLGHWYSALGLARGLREYPKAELVAAAWDNETQLEAFTRTFGVKGYRDYGELLERERVDIVHLAAPVAQLADLTIRSANAGKHIILGKPMAMNAGEADRMIDAVEAAGVSCLAFQGISRLRCAGNLSQTTNSGDPRYRRRWARKMMVSSLPTAFSKISK